MKLFSIFTVVLSVAGAGVGASASGVLIPEVLNKAALHTGCSQLCKIMDACRLSGKGSHCKNSSSVDGICQGLFQVIGGVGLESFRFHSERFGDGREVPVGCVAADSFFRNAPHLVPVSTIAPLFTRNRSVLRQGIPTTFVDQLSEALSTAMQASIGSTSSIISVPSSDGQPPLSITLKIEIHLPPLANGATTEIPSVVLSEDEWNGTISSGIIGTEVVITREGESSEATSATGTPCMTTFIATTEVPNYEIEAGLSDEAPDRTTLIATTDVPTYVIESGPITEAPGMFTVIATTDYVIETSPSTEAPDMTDVPTYVIEIGPTAGIPDMTTVIATTDVPTYAIETSLISQAPDMMNVIAVTDGSTYAFQTSSTTDIPPVNELPYVVPEREHTMGLSTPPTAEYETMLEIAPLRSEGIVDLHQRQRHLAKVVFTVTAIASLALARSIPDSVVQDIAGRLWNAFVSAVRVTS